MRLALFALFWLLAIVSLAYWLVDTGRWTPARPDFSHYPVVGVDVSRHQGNIDWDRLAEAGVDFAYIKATEGGDWTDPQFARNWRGAEAAGIPRGAYHFFTFCRAPEEQAAHVLQTVPQTPEALPLAVDVEYGGNCTDYGSEGAVRQRLDRLLQIVSDSLGYAPVLYATFASYPDFVEGRYPQSPVWIQNVVVEPSLEGGRGWTIWQWSKAGRLPGVEGPVDLNVFRGDAAAFRAFARPDLATADELVEESLHLLVPLHHTGRPDSTGRPTNHGPSD